MLKRRKKRRSNRLRLSLRPHRLLRLLSLL